MNALHVFNKLIQQDYRGVENRRAKAKQNSLQIAATG